MESILFYLFATVLVVSAAMVVTIRNPVKAALFLVLSFFSAACIWMTLEAEFLSIALVLVYVGAVMVLFLFVVMMLDIDVESMREGFARNLPVGALVAGVMVVEFAVVMMSDRFDSQSLPRPAGHGPDYSNTKELGLVLYTDYVFAFEVAGLILLVAIVAAIVLTMRRRPNTRYQSPSEQVKVNKSERLRIVSMPAEKRLDIDN
ncbi:MAG: NADH:ubiquinone oxidoreductase subunit J [Candidatus Thioglobus sp. MED-G25]|jgi:NADH-quinone oxidoreductase subunit J|nr:MAG: NADH:ubiquinone oxidoreductase subunit J [Candidatus Thioglobus sp. MED-G25]HAC88210.1 NADH-quinone oxidoreductase subunit J [Gammaproteobacteria bacterium]